ncbi:MAG: GTPase ObgE [Rhodothermales bacterium]
MKFVDYVTITVRSGKGGAGATMFRREKYVPRGGPNGGNGGNGGSVILTGDKRLYTLLDLRYNRHHFAENGQRGQGSNKTGKDGEDIILRVPVGTVATNTDTGEVIDDIVDDGDTIVLAQGGRGGMGNTHFKSSTNQTPRYSQPGEEGEELNVTLELKLLADVGLVGFPNAGKSTLISAISAAKPKVADYPFTTLEPSLGMVYLDDYESFVMADIPGIIEGAHEGKGLGLQFLKHIERNAVLLFVIPVTSEDWVAEYETLLGELRAYDANVLNKPRHIALSKIDLLSPEERAELPAKVNKAFGTSANVTPISSVAQQNLKTLKQALWKPVQQARAWREEAAASE